MALDPQAKMVLDQMQAAGVPDLSDLEPAAARVLFEQMRPPIEPEPVAAVENRSIDGPGGAIPVRIYSPAGNGPRPALVYFHGGGFVIGSLETHDHTCRALANAARCVVVAVDYRLAPESKFPAALDDCYAATSWVAENGLAIGVDPSRIAVGGDSAGGNLAAVVALLARERGGPRLAFQLLVYPATDAACDTASCRENAEGYLLTRRTMLWFWDNYLADPADGRSPLASPLRAEKLDGLPPALIITAEYDPLRDEGEAYAERLREAGVPVECARYAGMFHGFFGMEHWIDRGKEALAQAGGALQTAFGP